MRRWLVLLFPIALFACKEAAEPDVVQYQAPTILDVQAIGGNDYSQLTIVCTLSSTKGIKECGICFGEIEMQTIPAEGFTDNGFSITVSGLKYSTVYHYQAYIDGGAGPVFSKTGSWKTVDEIPPVPQIIKTSRRFGSDAGKVSLDCFIYDIAGVVGTDALKCGVCYAPGEVTPSLEGPRKEAAGFSEDGNYSVLIDGLATSTTYSFRPYTSIGQEVSYGETFYIAIPSASAVVVTEGYRDLTHHSVTLEGVLSEDISSAESVICAFEINGTAILASNLDDSHHFSLSLDNLSPGTDYNFRAVVHIDNSSFFGETKSFRTFMLPGGENGFVDLGLSVLWAECNLGASTPSEEGNIYAWGEIDPRDNFGGSWSSYKWSLGTEESIFKYCLPSYSTQADNKTVLDPEDDAVTTALGNKWRTPTASECIELLNNANVVRMQVEGKDGFLITSKVPGFNDKSIFLPNFTYWTASLCTDYTPFAQAMLYDRAFDVLDVKDIIDYSPDILFSVSFLQIYLSRYNTNYIRPVRDR